MAKHNELGEWGEQLAQNHLKEKGYAILETNWRLGKLEADIIAYKDGEIVFVEVKTRSSDRYGEPQEFVDMRKGRSYLKLANAYIQQHHRQETCRLDVIAILVKDSSYEINHIENAFSAIGMYR